MLEYLYKEMLNQFLSCLNIFVNIFLNVEDFQFDPLDKYAFCSILLAL